MNYYNFNTFVPDKLKASVFELLTHNAPKLAALQNYFLSSKLPAKKQLTELAAAAIDEVTKIDKTSIVITYLREQTKEYNFTFYERVKAKFLTGASLYEIQKHFGGLLWDSGCNIELLSILVSSTSVVCVGNESIVYYAFPEETSLEDKLYLWSDNSIILADHFLVQ